jgi:hypothetical protein
VAACSEDPARKPAYTCHAASHRRRSGVRTPPPSTRCTLPPKSFYTCIYSCSSRVSNQRTRIQPGLMAGQCGRAWRPWLHQTDEPGSVLQRRKLHTRSARRLDHARQLEADSPGRWSRSSRRALARTHCLSAHPRSGGCNGRNVPDPANPADPRIGADWRRPVFSASVPGADLRPLRRRSVYRVVADSLAKQRW